MSRTHRWISRACLYVGLSFASFTWAAEATTSASVSDSLGRMVMGTLVVLLVIGGLAWFARKVLPSQHNAQAGVIKQVANLQLAPRERVVVLEVGNKWFLVGLHAGHMTPLGEVSADSVVTDQSLVPTPSSLQTATTPSPIDANASFAKRLQQAMQHTLQQRIHPPK